MMCLFTQVAVIRHHELGGFSLLETRKSEWGGVLVRVFLVPSGSFFK